MDYALTTTTSAEARLSPEFIAQAQRTAQVGSALSKRLFDVFFSLALLAFFAPLLVTVAMLVRATSNGPALFRQRRTGLNGKVFHIYKFRTMTVMEDGDVRAAGRGDRRVTQIGAMLRRSSLDELPQLLNVLKGDMSLVGPRPHALAHDDLYATILPEYGARYRARPGLTGLAQITGYRGEVKTMECLQGRVGADNRYIAQWTLMLDLKILIQTGLLFWRDDRAY
jgi:putative colanic acid biosynthesis UDP-glucose lipid carrier transferase